MPRRTASFRSPVQPPLGNHSRELSRLVASVFGALMRAMEEGAKVSPLYVEVQIRLSHNLDINVPAQNDLQAGSE